MTAREFAEWWVFHGFAAAPRRDVSEAEDRAARALMRRCTRAE